MTIAEFLEARLAEDEIHARANAEMVYVGKPYESALTMTRPVSRALREVEAKRAILARWQQLNDTIEWLRLPIENPAVAGQHGERAGLAEVLMLLASVYAEDPDYDQAWDLTDVASMLKTGQQFRDARK